MVGERSPTTRKAKSVRPVAQSDSATEPCIKAVLHFLLPPELWGCAQNGAALGRHVDRFVKLVSAPSHTPPRPIRLHRWRVLEVRHLSVSVRVSMYRRAVRRKVTFSPMARRARRVSGVYWR